MDLTYDEIDKYLEQVFTGTKAVDIDDDVVLFKFPDLKTRMYARRIYEYEYKRSIEDGLLPVDEMKKLLESRQLITDSDKNTLKKLKGQLEAQKVLLGKTTRVKANQDRIKKVIYDLEEKIRVIEYKERSKLYMSAENKAEESRLLYLCWASSFDLYTDKLFWSKYEDFLHEHNLTFRSKVVSEFILFFSGIPTPAIRAISRSNLWRIRYMTSLKTSDPLFGRAAAEYTNDMLNLAYWSHYYQNVYEMLPDSQPSELVIEDDDALDAYLKSYYDEQKREAQIRQHRRPNKANKLSAFDKEEVIVTRGSELYQDIEYDVPREAQAIKDRNLINKKVGQSSKHRRGTTPENLPRR